MENYKTKSYEDVELTDDEVKEVLSQAKSKKAAKLREIDYWNRVNNPEKIYVPTDEEYLTKIFSVENPDFINDDDNDQAVDLLKQYFTGDKTYEKYGSLSKGLMLVGPVGCGKTTLMRMFNRNVHNPFVMVSSRRIAEDFSAHGEESFSSYIGIRNCQPKEWYGHNRLGLCIDDLGTETNKKHYGNEANVMKEIILTRYDNPILKGKTHFTTNLTVDQIDELYGERVRSRLREMVNMIEFNPTSPDRRK